MYDNKIFATTTVIMGYLVAHILGDRPILHDLNSLMIKLITYKPLLPNIQVLWYC